MKVKTSELIGPALDWAVAKCEDVLELIELEQVNGKWNIAVPDLGCYFEPSMCWSQGGPIIEQEELSVEPLYTSGGLYCWQAHGHNLRYDDHGNYIQGSDNMKYGPTPLIAAMLCYVASKLGEVVDVPEELI